MPHRFPMEAALRDGRRVLVRPFEEGDVAALWAFFRRLPDDVRRLAWDDIGDRAVVEHWGRNIDYAKVLPLLAWADGRVVADATLHRRSGGPLRLVGRVKWLLDPDYQGAGLATTLINTLIGVAREQGLHHVSCMLVEDFEAEALATLDRLGFERVRIPRFGTDPDGERHDMVYLWLEL